MKVNTSLTPIQSVVAGKASKPSKKKSTQEEQYREAKRKEKEVLAKIKEENKELAGFKENY